MDPNPNNKPKKKQTGKTPESNGGKLSADDAAMMIPTHVLQMLQNLIRPVSNFHTQAESAAETDVHIFWDVRAVKGGGDNISHLVGSSTMSGLLYGRMMAEASTIIEAEIFTKITQPMVAKFQELADAAEKAPTISPVTAREIIAATGSGHDIAHEMSINGEISDVRNVDEEE